MSTNGHILQLRVNASRLKHCKGKTDGFYFASQQLHDRDAAARGGRS